MLNYELCKKLKDAGFPQNGSKPMECSCGNYVYRSKQIAENKDGSELVSEPTLSELIEACGLHREYGVDDTKFDFSLICAETDRNEWRAGYLDASYHEAMEEMEYGKTPEEAVCQLWLALHSNPKPPM